MANNIYRVDLFIEILNEWYTIAKFESESEANELAKTYTGRRKCQVVKIEKKSLFG